MRSKGLMLLLAIVIGAIDAVLFKVFEYIVNHGTQYIWNDLFNSDVDRWKVVPLGIVLGLLLSGLFVLLKQKRIVPPKLSSVEEESSDEKPTLASLGIIFIIGAACLLAGASLGPEASLVAMTGGLGLWFGYYSRNDKAAKLLQLSSIGALLVAFFGSIILILLPLAMLLKKKKLSVTSAIPIVLAGASSYGALWLMDRNTEGYGSIPVPSSFHALDYLLAALLGMATAVLGWLLKKYILKANEAVKRYDKNYHWAISGALFGLVIGLLYMLGGQSVEFSGSEGTKLLMHHSPEYSVWALVVILLAKLLVTGWSLASGYRGGLVFPSIFIGVAIALIAETITGDTSTGVLVGSIAGVFCAMLGPAPALIFIIALIPFKLIGIAIVGIVFAALANKIIDKHAPIL